MIKKVKATIKKTRIENRIEKKVEAPVKRKRGFLDFFRSSRAENDERELIETDTEYSLEEILNQFSLEYPNGRESYGRDLLEYTGDLLLISIYLNNYINTLHFCEGHEVFEAYENKSDIPVLIISQRESGEPYDYYLLSNNVYAVKNEFFDTMNDLKALILAYEIKLKKKLERAKTIVTSQNIHNQRSPIPDDVKVEVWRRDGGKCVKCGSQHHLEYDHIIPLSNGGSNTARNLQILCRSCNREKSDNIS